MVYQSEHSLRLISQQIAQQDVELISSIIEADNLLADRAL